MLRNYIKIAWRNIIKNRVYSFINVIGLSIGIAFTLLIAAYVWNEGQVNKKLTNADRQYLIQSEWKKPNEGYDFATSAALAKVLKENYPNLIANYYRFDGITSNVSKGGKGFREDIAICDSTMLTMYGFPLLYGSARDALRAPFTAIITKEKAIKYFGRDDVVGQTISIENFSGSRHDFLITGVLENLPDNSVTGLVNTYPNEIFISTDNLSYFGRNMEWYNPHIAGFVELKKGVNPKDLQQPMVRLLKKNAPDYMATDMKPYLTKLNDYYASANNSLVRKMIYALSAVALFILIMAVINFINMSVSRSASRMREIGIRKVLGGLRKQLIAQFLIESVIITLLATLIAFVIYFFVRNFFSDIVNKPVPSLLAFPAYYLLLPVLFVLVIGSLAGIYPAFVLSSLRSVDSLKGKPSVKEKVWTRKSLVGFQFAIATIAFVGAIVISKEINLFLKSDLGYNKDYILSAQLPRDWSRAGVDKAEAIRDQFAALPFVKDVSLSFDIPDGNNTGETALYKSGNDSTQSIAASILENDERYLSLYQIPLLAGSPFQGRRLDSLQVILNETAVKALNWKSAKEAIGKQVRIPGLPDVYTVRGVTNDFHFGSMQTKVPPIVMFNVQYDFIYRFLSFKINPGDVGKTVNALQKKWSAILPGIPFEYKFMDDTLAKMYQSEIRLKKASYTATALALFIVLLGVVGLISLSIQKRTKEIGIRKVLGSSVPAIVSLFIREFLWVVVIAGFVACPLAYWIMSRWLQDYAYRIDITAQPFLLSVFCLGLITVLLICVQTIKAAVANPVKSLRTE